MATSLYAADTPQQILAQPTVRAPMKANEPHFIDNQARLCEIASPPF